MVKIYKKTIKEDFESAVMKGNKRRKYLLKKLIVNIVDENYEKVQKLVQAGAEVNGVDNLGMNPLTYAVGTGNITMIDYLIENGADVNSVDVSGMTPLMRTIKNYKFNEGYYIVKALLKRGADVTLGFEGKSPLVFAMLYNPLYTGILKRFGAKF